MTVGLMIWPVHAQHLATWPTVLNTEGRMAHLEEKWRFISISAPPGAPPSCRHLLILQREKQPPGKSGPNTSMCLGATVRDRYFYVRFMKQNGVGCFTEQRRQASFFTTKALNINLFACCMFLLSLSLSLSLYIYIYIYIQVRQYI